MGVFPLVPIPPRSTPARRSGRRSRRRTRPRRRSRRCRRGRVRRGARARRDAGGHHQSPARPTNYFGYVGYDPATGIASSSRRLGHQVHARRGLQRLRLARQPRRHGGRLVRAAQGGPQDVRDGLVRQPQARRARSAIRGRASRSAPTIRASSRLGRARRARRRALDHLRRHLRHREARRRGPRRHRDRRGLADDASTSRCRRRAGSTSTRSRSIVDGEIVDTIPVMPADADPRTRRPVAPAGPGAGARDGRLRRDRGVRRRALDPVHPGAQAVRRDEPDLRRALAVSGIHRRRGASRSTRTGRSFASSAWRGARTPIAQGLRMLGGPRPVQADRERDAAADDRHGRGVGGRRLREHQGASSRRRGAGRPRSPASSSALIDAATGRLRALVSAGARRAKPGGREHGDAVEDRDMRGSSPTTSDAIRRVIPRLAELARRGPGAGEHRLNARDALGPLSDGDRFDRPRAPSPRARAASSRRRAGRSPPLAVSSTAISSAWISSSRAARSASASSSAECGDARRAVEHLVRVASEHVPNLVTDHAGELGLVAQHREVPRLM